jgi:aminocarboxymuconate-semialdehyde decarboxylase
MFYGDTALFGAEHAVRCAIDFFGVDRILFGSDMPFDPEKGPQFIRETIANLDALDLPAEDRRKIDEENARRVLRIPPSS